MFGFFLILTYYVINLYNILVSNNLVHLGSYFDKSGQSLTSRFQDFGTFKVGQGLDRDHAGGGRSDDRARPRLRDVPCAPV